MTRNPIRLRADFYDFEACEQGCAASADSDLAEPLKLADAAAGCLAHLTWHFEVPSHTEPLPASVARKEALLPLAALSIRTSRALILLVRNGWDAEAHGLKRRLTECRLRAQHVEDDASGEAARQWLGGRGKKADALAARYDARDPWAIFSSGSHADVRSLRLTMAPPPWIDIGVADRAVLLTPHRDREHAHGLLLDTAFDAVALMEHLTVVFEHSFVLDNELGRRLVAARGAFEDQSAVLSAARNPRGSALD